jgi:alpha-tubulin suppressor-like RCC1 family protein
VAVTGLSDVAEVHSGDTHTCARTTAGQIYCWGDSHDGQLGTGVSHFVRQPSRVTF